MGNSIDFDAAKRIALATMAEWLPGYSSGKTSNDEFILPSPLRNDNHAGSFSINTRTGLFNDFASGDSGDILSLYAKIKGISDGEAAKSLSVKKSDYNFDSFIKNSSIGKPPVSLGFSDYYHYTDGQGFDCYVYRYDQDGKKTFRPWYHDGSAWVCKRPEKPLSGFPLFNLSGVISDTISDIVIVEGEKSARAVPEEYIAVTWMGGAQSVKNTDFSPLKGRNVILWPDNDDPGREAMDYIVQTLKPLGCKIKRIVPSESWGKGADIADFEPEASRSILSKAPIVFEERDLFPLTRYGDMIITAPKWIVKDFFEENCLAQFFGESGVGKSYAVIDMAMSITTGKDFHGKEIKKSGPVIYIAGEGFAGISRRMKAWELYNDIDASKAPIFVSHKACGLGDPELMAHVQKSIKAVSENYGSPTLIIIDTWSRSLIGNENSSEDTARAIRSLDDLRGEYGCSALIVHHSGLNEKERARGSSVLRAALDAEYFVGKEGETLAIRNTKMKDGAIPHPLGFDFQSVDLGFYDEDGNPVISAALSSIDGFATGKPKKACIGKNESMVMDILHNHGGTLSGAELRTFSGLDRKRYPETIKSLVSKNKIEVLPGDYIKVPLYSYMQ